MGFIIVLLDLSVQCDEVRDIGGLPDGVVLRKLRTDVFVAGVLIQAFIVLVAIGDFAWTEVRTGTALFGIGF